MATGGDRFILNSLVTKARFFLAETIQFTKETLHHDRSRHSAPDPTELEHRVMLSASPLAAAPAPDAAVLSSDTVDITQGTRGSEIVFVDAQADPALAEDLLQSAADRDIVIYQLRADRDGIAQIQEQLAGHRDVQAVHIVSHGRDGEIQLGASTLSLDSLQGYAGMIASWGDALHEDADMLIYGCNLARNDAGRELAEAISTLCQCDVAASDDLTGNATLGGDWDLEFDVGVIETPVVFSEEFQLTWNAVLDGITATDDSYATGPTTILTVDATNGVLTNDNSDSIVTPGAALNFDAALDTDGDFVWHDSGNVAGFDWDLGSDVDRNANPDTTLHGITAAYDFDGDTFSRAVLTNALQTLPGDPTSDDASFEIWFQKDQPNRRQLLFESGSASGAGISLKSNNAMLEFLVWDGASNASVTYDLSAEFAADDFVQVVGTIHIDANGMDLHLYVNGAEVAASLDNAGLSDWSDGSETAGLANVDGSTLVLAQGSTFPFEGEIAITRFYDFALSSTQVTSNYDAIVGSSAGLTATNLDTATDGTRGTVSLNPDGSFQYDLNGAFASLPEGATTTDRFRYDATDGTLMDTAIVDITITGANDAPSSTGFVATIAENTGNGTLIGTVNANDIDLGDTLTYAIVNGDPGNAFQIDGSGNVFVNDRSQLDREAVAQFSLTVQVQDAGGLTSNASVVINLVDENEVFPVVLAGQSFSVAEDAANGLSLGTLSASDGDVTPTTLQDWTIVGGHSVFSLNASTGELRVLDNSSLDFESGVTNYSIDVTVSDGTNVSLTVPVTVNVTDINEPPSIALANVAMAVPENLDTTNSVKVADIVVTDDALGTNMLLLSGADAGLFAISSSGPGNLELHIAAGVSLDVGTNPVLDVTVGVDDTTNGAGLEASDAASITVSNTNVPPIADATPTANYVVAEGSTIQLDGSDSHDLDGTVVAYEWDLDFTGVFNIDATGIGPTFDATSIDGPATRTVALRVIDDDGLTSSIATVNVSILNVAPTGVADAGLQFTTDEESAVQTGDATANDFDPAGAQDPLTITAVDVTGTLGSVIIRADNRSFLYVPSVLFNSLPGNATAVDQFTYTVSDDDGGTTSSIPVTITIIGINDAPTATGFVTTISENAVNGTVVGTIVGSDVDVNEPLTYAITDGNTSNAFLVDGFGTVHVNDATVLDREQIAQFLLTVTVTDASGLSAITTAEINLADTNDVVPSITANQAFSVDENAATGTRLGNIVATDSDVTPTTLGNWTIVSGNSDGIFGIDPVTGELQVVDNTRLDFERLPNNYRLGIRVSDGVNLAPETSVSVAIRPLNDNLPQLPAGLVYTVTDQQTVVGTLPVFDADLPNQPIVLTLAGTGPDDALFRINARNELVFATPPKFDSPTDQGGDNIYNVNVVASDGSGGTTTTSLAVRVVPPIVAPPSAESTPAETEFEPESTSESAPETAANGPIVASPDATDMGSAAPPDDPLLRDWVTMPSTEITATPIPAISEFSAASAEGPTVAGLSRHAPLSNTLHGSISGRSTFAPEPFNSLPIDYVSNVILWEELDAMGEQLQVEFEMPDVYFVSTTGFTSALTVGYVMWLLKGGHLLAGVLAQVPAWKLIDPLPIMAHLDALGDDELDDDSLQTLMHEADHDLKTSNETRRKLR